MKKKLTREIVMYVIFGVLTTVVSWGAYTLFVNICHMGVFLANLLSWVCAVSFAYVTNKLWVFDSKSWEPRLVIKELVGFFGSRGATGVIEIVVVPLLARIGFDTIFYSVLDKLGVTAKILFTDGIYSKIVVAFVVVILNYVFSKLIVFKKGDETE